MCMFRIYDIKLCKYDGINNETKIINIEKKVEEIRA